MGDMDEVWRKKHVRRRRALPGEDALGSSLPCEGGGQAWIGNACGYIVWGVGAK